MVNVGDFFRLGRALMNSEAAAQLEPVAKPFVLNDAAAAQEYIDMLQVGAVPFDKALYLQAKSLLDLTTSDQTQSHP